ncbi:MAG: cell wall-active antibiotics response protein [Acidobacteria bacterium]|nr:cell wall-active antibiotics response protein [Acidobacteriota bacterium]MBU1475132.1 cell wall-active antibiotics response protein [Acidobacteriota bacterium]MBU4203500.1 cell wall-active antibiotics response protein [Acidobacteriota bacterium]
MSKHDYSGRLFSGLLIVTIGLIFLLGSLGKLHVGQIFAVYWPLILIYFGAWHMFSKGMRSPVTGFVLLVVGAVFLLRNLDILSWSVFRYIWPVAIVLVGLWIIFGSRFKVFSGDIPAVEGDDLGIFLMFSGVKKAIESKEFRGGKATVIFGGVELEFGGAKLKEGKAIIDATAIFGGLEIRVPDTWKVVVDSNGIFGGVEDKRRVIEPKDPEATLFVRATAIFGGIEIKN